VILFAVVLSQYASVTDRETTSYYDYSGTLHIQQTVAICNPKFMYFISINNQICQLNVLTASLMQLLYQSYCVYHRHDLDISMFGNVLSLSNRGLTVAKMRTI